VHTRLAAPGPGFLPEKDTAIAFTRPRHWLRWLIGAVAAAAVLAAAGPFVYIHFLNSAPTALSLSPDNSASSSPSAGAATAPQASGPVAGTWTAGSGSVVGYRVNEVLLGQNATAVGRTTSVTGHLTIQRTTATAASFSVPMDTIHSDKSQRDAQFDGRIMDVAQYPTATFTLTSPIDLAPLPAPGVIKSYTAHGRLTLHGTTRTVAFTLTAERGAAKTGAAKTGAAKTGAAKTGAAKTGAAKTGAAKTGAAQIDVVGHIPVLFSDYNIQNPSFAGFVTTQDHGLLEFLLVLSRT
jgi:polyisoprenoid-binding protein YceI